MNRFLLPSSAALGLVLAISGFSVINSEETPVRGHRNPFAIQQSGYGKTVARLSQDTVNVYWHIGVEGVNPVGHGHEHGDHGHSHGEHDHDDHGHDHDDHGHDHDDHGHDHDDHGHDHDDHGHDHDDHGHDHDDHGHDHDDHGALAESVDLQPLTEEEWALLREAGFAENDFDCPECQRLALKAVEEESPLSKEDLPALHAFHADEWDGGVELAEAGHDHSVEPPSGEQLGMVTVAKDWLQAMNKSRFAKTSRFGINDAHRNEISREIEQMYLRAYLMDPTDYGVYNGYFLFLTIHELRGTPAAREHARKISQMTIGKARAEEIDPQPWVTAAMATLNLFFLDQEDSRTNQTAIPSAMLVQYQQQMRYCLQQYEILREKAIAEGRWDLISQVRKDDMEERAGFAGKTMEQFTVMLARQEASEGDVSPSEPRPEASATTARSQESEIGGE